MSELKKSIMSVNPRQAGWGDQSEAIGGLRHSRSWRIGNRSNRMDSSRPKGIPCISIGSVDSSRSIGRFDRVEPTDRRGCYRARSIRSTRIDQSMGIPSSSIDSIDSSPSIDRSDRLESVDRRESHRARIESMDGGSFSYFQVRECALAPDEVT